MFRNFDYNLEMDAAISAENGLNRMTSIKNVAKIAKTHLHRSTVAPSNKSSSVLRASISKVSIPVIGRFKNIGDKFQNYSIHLPCRRY